MKKAPALLLLILSFSLAAWYHDSPNPTNEFVIKGKLKNEVTISLAELNSMVAVPIGNIKVTNHKGDVKEEIKNVYGVSFKNILSKAILPFEKPKELSSFYFVCIATDSHQVVFSWNEIFNTDVGNNVYLITEKNGIKLKDIPERILLLSKSDSLSGRRYLKNLKEVRVERVP